MSDFRSAIDRALERNDPRWFTVETFHERRLRIDRRRRTTAGVVGVVVGGLVVLSIVMGLRSWTVPRPATPITPFTVSSLGVAWSDDTGASINSPPTVVGDRVYVTN